jgi:hypothetical protein
MTGSSKPETSCASSYCLIDAPPSEAPRCAVILLLSFRAESRNLNLSQASNRRCVDFARHDRGGHAEVIRSRARRALPTGATATCLCNSMQAD